MADLMLTVGIPIVSVVAWHCTSNKVVRGGALALMLAMVLIHTFANAVGVTGDAMYMLPNGQTVTVAAIWKGEMAIATIALGLMTGGFLTDKIGELLRSRRD
jgi:hypothetical protein